MQKEMQEQMQKRVAEISEKIDAAKERLAQLKKLQHRIQAQKRAVDARLARAQDTRRKILVGAVLLHAIDLGKVDQEWLTRLLNEGLSKDQDRTLFGLAIREEMTCDGSQKTTALPK